MAIQRPLTSREYAIITNIEKIKLLVDNIKLVSLYISKLPLAYTKEININIKLTIPVIIDDKETLKNLPTIISLLLIGKVSSVSSVPLSFSPAVVSVAGYVADIVIAIIIKRKP